MSPSHDTRPEPLGDRAALTRWLRERGVVVPEGYDDVPAEIRARCPWCKHKGKGTWTFSVNVETGLWRCYHADCHDEDGNWRGGSLAKLARKLGGEEVPHNRRPYQRKRSRDSSGALVPIVEQLALAATLLEEGQSYNVIVRTVRAEFGVSERTAKNRIADVRNGGGGARRQEALRLAEHWRKGRTGKPSGSGLASPFLKCSTGAKLPQQEEEEVEREATSRVRAKASAAPAPLSEEEASAPEGVSSSPPPLPSVETLHLAGVAA
jgi:hypothetical protein